MFTAAACWPTCGRLFCLLCLNRALRGRVSATFAGCSLPAAGRASFCCGQPHLLWLQPPSARRTTRCSASLVYRGCAYRWRVRSRVLRCRAAADGVRLATRYQTWQRSAGARSLPWPLVVPNLCARAPCGRNPLQALRRVRRIAPPPLRLACNLRVRLEPEVIWNDSPVWSRRVRLWAGAVRRDALVARAGAAQSGGRARVVTRRAGAHNAGDFCAAGAAAFA